MYGYSPGQADLELVFTAQILFLNTMGVKYIMNEEKRRKTVKILLTNDDGIHAPGLMALYKELNGDYDVSVVAPESEMSAVGHAITLASPLRVQEVHKNGTFFGYGVKGTPADCVKIALQELDLPPPRRVADLPEEPDQRSLLARLLDLFQIKPAHLAVDRTRIVGHSRVAERELHRAHVVIQPLVCRIGLFVHRLVVELPVVIDVGQPSEQRNVPVGETAEDIEPVLFDPLGQLGEDIIAVGFGIQRVELSHCGEDEQHQKRRSPQA